MSVVMPGESEEAAPLYRRIEHTLWERITAGTWAVGQALPRRSRLCAEFGTTRVTIDKAIHELVRAGLLQSGKGSGTFVAPPKPFLAGLSGLHFAASPRALRLGIVLERTMPGDGPPEEGWNDNFYFGPLFQGIRDGIVGQTVETIYAHLGRGEYGSFYRDSELDGMILIAPSRDDLPTLHQLNAAGLMFVAVGISSPEPEDSAMPCVDTDNMCGASEAIWYLLGLGHRRIAIVNLATAHANHHDRLQGYRRTMAAVGQKSRPMT